MATRSSEERPRITKHAAEQWVRRGGWTCDSPTWVTVQNAWSRGQVVDGDHGFEADEVRFDPDEEMFLLRKDTSIVTVLPKKTARPKAAAVVPAE